MSLLSLQLKKLTINALV